MSLLVNPVSNVSFRAQDAVAEHKLTPEEILSRPGAFAKPEPQVVNKPPKKHKALKTFLGILVGAAVVAGALVALKHSFKDTFKVVENIKDLNLQGTEKYKTYLTSGIAKGAEYVEAGAGWLTKQCTDKYDKLLKFLKIRKA